MKKCKCCGTNNTNKADFCIECGCSFNNVEDTENKPIDKLQLIKVICIVVIIVSIISIFFSLGNMNKNTNYITKSYVKEEVKESAKNVSEKKQERTTKRIDESIERQIETEEQKKIGWIEEDNNWHYYNEQGKMVKNDFVDVEYYTDEKGNKEVIGIYYVDKKGNMVTNSILEFEGTKVKFDENGIGKRFEELELVGGIKNTSARYDGWLASYITGVVKNNTDKKYSYVQITFKLYDADGAKVGEALANTNNLEPGEKWKFNAMGMTDFETYKLDEITGW